TLGGEVTSYPSTHEVMGSRVANVLNNSRVYVPQIDETFGQSRARYSRAWQYGAYQGNANTDEHGERAHRPCLRDRSDLTKGRRRERTKPGRGASPCRHRTIRADRGRALAGRRISSLPS